MPRKVKKLKKCVILNVFPKKLPTCVLPTVGDIVLYHSFVANELQSASVDRHIFGARAKNIVAEQVIKLWQKASIPTASIQFVATVVGKLVQQRLKL
jgi:hypothetical protein